MTETLEKEIGDALEIVNSGMKKVEEVVKVIEVLNSIENPEIYSNLNGDKLSRLAMKLSILNVNIGIKAAEAVMSANMGYGYRKFQYASEWKITKERIAKAIGKVTNEDVKNELEVKNWTNFKNEMVQKLDADKLMALNSGIDSILIAIGYRLNTLKQERMSTKYNNS